jgi:hypothetical protein
MCSPCTKTPTDYEILDFLAEHDFAGDINPDIARHVAADYLSVYPRDGEVTNKLVASFKGEDGKVIPLNKDQRRRLADLIFPSVDSS